MKIETLVFIVTQTSMIATGENLTQGNAKSWKKTAFFKSTIFFWIFPKMDLTSFLKFQHI